MRLLIIYFLSNIRITSNKDMFYLNILVSYYKKIILTTMAILDFVWHTRYQSWRLWRQSCVIHHINDTKYFLNNFLLDDFLDIICFMLMILRHSFIWRLFLVIYILFTEKNFRQFKINLKILCRITWQNKWMPLDSSLNGIIYFLIILMIIL